MLSLRLTHSPVPNTLHKLSHACIQIPMIKMIVIIILWLRKPRFTEVSKMPDVTQLRLEFRFVLSSSCIQLPQHMVTAVQYMAKITELKSL